MLTVSNLCKNASCLLQHARRKSKVHWAKLRRKTSPQDKAMSHFDDFYGSVFGGQWAGMREALLKKRKYVALINNYGDPEETMEYLGNRGAHCLKTLIEVQKKFDDQYSTNKPEQPTEHNNRVQDYVSRLQSEEISGIYSHSDAQPDKIETAEFTLNRGQQDEAKKPKPEILRNKTLEETLAEAEIDVSRQIEATHGLSAEALYQYVPATKLKGMDDWVPESIHYSYYSNEQDFPLIVEQDPPFTFPEHLKVFTYERDSDWSDFPEPKRCTTGVYNYYPLDCGSVLCVLALGLRSGCRVLDLCSAPGGKTLTALQTLLPDVVTANDVGIGRSNRLRHVLKDYLIDFASNDKWRERLHLTMYDGRMFTDDLGFDHVLVDVPCTTDRHSVTTVTDNNLFRPDRVKERLKLPEVQADLLASALNLVNVGGTVVYSTCSLSPIQNDGVVKMALAQVFRNRNITAAVRDLTTSFTGLSSVLRLATGNIKPKYGQLVLPTVGANFGPTYIAKLVRLQ